MDGGVNLGNFLKNNNERDYWLDVCVRMAHHSTAIEGNTLSQDETASILLDGYIAKATSEREFYEVKNYRQILPKMFSSLQEKAKIDEKLIKDFHRLIMNNLIDNNGKFKTIENLVVGANFEPTKPYLVPVAIKDMCDNLYFRLDNAKNDDDKLKAILQSHIKFEKIHPFSDGNGRTGRIIMIYGCLENNLAPIIIPKEQKNRYIAILRNNDIDGFMAFAKEIEKDEISRRNKFLSQRPNEQDNSKSVLSRLGNAYAKKLESGAIKALNDTANSKEKER
ncbi:TPA: Fic family protein [Campylobacter fetus subsp. venerealis]|uniref:Fic family protein n=3 Tax=Campylobacter fetus TaxID=196 RepID=A0A7D7Q668_CAMFE|nr:Fic family protein [Campylobacter fetus]ACA64462.2 Fic protein [Campylobacter fetus subsp. venerealis NCTC 10354]AIR80966.1 Fic domain protein [Campylobacter fetus subsp. venerealis 97/608]EAK0836153.1 Fic family protein [Campylobacter fetus]EGU24820.1 Fic protein [Campylobacter fetus subsp. venerealis NCTC 10354]KAA3683779.1 Fic family protein [Campylobacter fetus subsp. fetus]